MKLEELKAKKKAEKAAAALPRTVDGLDLAQLEKLISLRMAGERLLPFTLHTKPDYQAEWFHGEVAAALEQFLVDVAAKKRPRVIITAPPQHGKSELVSRRFPAWALGRQPDIRIIATSYSADLAEAFSLDVQRIIETPEYRGVFPGTVITGEYAPNATERRRADVFEIVGRRGGYRAAGVGGGITGQSADILIVDDPIKDFTQAHSEAYRNTLENWYKSTAYTRLSSGGGVLVMQTRWHEDDLVGRLLARMKSGGDQWRVINFPAVAEANEPRRQKGDALAPLRFSGKDLDGIRATLGAYQWAALYQQRPAPAEGGIWKRDWWKFWGDRPGLRRLPKRFDLELQSWDCAFKDTDGSDYVCGGAWGSSGADIYLLPDAVHRRLAFGATVGAVRTLTAKYSEALAKLIEDKANGPAVIDSLKHEISGIIAINPEGGKVARAHAVSPVIEAGNVYLPDPNEHPWVNDLIEECASFPNGAHDDWVDMISQALNWWRGSCGGVLAYYRQEAEKAGECIVDAKALPAASDGAKCAACGGATRYSGFIPSEGIEQRECVDCGALARIMRAA